MIHVFCNLEEESGDARPLCDMTFEIVEKSFDDADGAWRLMCRADADSDGVVGFRVDIPMSGWNEQIDGEGEEAFHSFWGKAQLHSQGVESDRLINLIAGYYGVEPESPVRSGGLRALFQKAPNGRSFVDQIDCLAVGIASDPRNVESEPVHLKLFFDDGIENGRYAEVFLDVDLPSGFLMLNEKDEEYRRDLTYWLSLPGQVSANPNSAPGTIGR